MVLAVVVVCVLATVGVVMWTEHPAHPVFYGVSASDAVTISRTTTIVGRQPSVENIFVKLDSPHFDLSTMRTIDAAGRTPMLTLEPWSWRAKQGTTDQPDYTLATIYTGQHDQDLKRIARTMAQFAKPVLLRFAHEMNGWWYPWAESENNNAAGEYIKAWRHTHDLFRAAGARNARWVWAPNALTPGHPQPSLAELYPGDAYVDVLGMTAFGHGPSVEDTIGATYRALAQLSDKPIIIAETGADGPHKTTWIAGFGPFVRAHSRIYGFVWGNATRASGATGDYRFDDTERNIVTFRKTLSVLLVR